MPDNGYGELAAALAKAQAAFPPIPRDKQVTVKLKSGDQYTFKYAPLDSILAAVRLPLADNGLAILQLLDEDVLVTSLLHSGGAIISGRTPIPATEGVQAYGSAITYLRRYAIQALLGIAAEEDDDGNRAAGNAATFRAKATTTDAGANLAGTVGQPDAEPAGARDQPQLIGEWTETGRLAVRKTGQADGELRQSPEGALLQFLLETVDDKTVSVIVEGQLATDLYDAAEGKIADLVATVSGNLYRVPWSKGGKAMRPYQRLDLRHIKTAGWSLPAPEAASVPLFDESELDAIPL